MKHTRNRSPVFRSLMLSNLALLVVPLIIGLTFYVRMIGTVTRENADINALMLGNVQHLVDGQLDELDKIASTLSASRNIQRLASLAIRSNGTEQRAILDAQRELSAYCATDDLIDDVYVCIPGRAVVTCANKFNADIMSRVIRTQLHLEPEEFTSLAMSRRVDPFRVCRLAPDGDPAVLFLRPFFVGGFSRPSGLIAIRLKAAPFTRLLGRLEPDGHAHVLLISALSEFCEAGPAPSCDGALTWQDLKGQPQDFTMKLDGVAVTVAHLPSRVISAEYVSVMETAYVYREVTRVRHGLLVYLGLCLLLGGCTAYALARRNYSPWHRLRRLLLSRLGAKDPSPDASRHEFRLMEESIRSLLETERQVQDIRQENERTERSRLLSRLLRGSAGETAPVLDRLRDLDVVFSRDHFLVIAVRVSGVEAGRSLSRDEDTRSLLGIVIRQLGEGFWDEKLCSPVLAEVEDDHVFILNYDVSESAVSERCRLAMIKMAAFARESLGIVLSIAISGEYSGLSGLPEAFSETRVALEFQAYIHFPNQVICFSDISSAPGPGENRSLSLTQQRQLINCLEARDYDGAARVLDSLLAVSLTSLQSVQIMKIRSFALINLLLGVLDDTGDPAVRDLYEDIRPVERLLSARTGEDFSEEVRLIFNLVIGILRQREEARVPDCVLEAEKYVNLHYASTSLSVAEVAEAVGVSVSYLSRSYKRWRGSGLLDYIHRVRLDAARDLLGTMSLSRVAKRVGYTDDKAFIRVYKKYEGTTPGRSAADWRDSNDT